MYKDAMYKDESGTAAIEFAIVGPVLVLLLMGMLAYGGYFWLAHAVQQTANDSARAAVAGLNASERQSLAQATMTTDLGASDVLAAQNATLTVNNGTNSITVTVSYDASQSPFFALNHLLPMPSPTIARSATVMIGGY